MTDLQLISDVRRLLDADTITIDQDGIGVWCDTAGWTVLPVLQCVPCQGDRPVVPLAGGAYRCAACGALFDPSEATDVEP